MFAETRSVMHLVFSLAGARRLTARGELALRDLFRALRTLRKSPVFAATVVLHARARHRGEQRDFLRFQCGGVGARTVSRTQNGSCNSLARSTGGRTTRACRPLVYRRLRAQTDVIEDVGAYRYAWVNYSSDEVLERLAVAQVTEPYFRTFRAPMALGRPFAVDEECPGAAKTAVVSYGSGRPGASAAIPACVGSTIRAKRRSPTRSSASRPRSLIRASSVASISGFRCNSRDGDGRRRVVSGGSAVEARRHAGAGASEARGVDRVARPRQAARAERQRPLRRRAVQGRVDRDGVEHAVPQRPTNVLWTLFGAVGCVLLIGVRERGEFDARAHERARARASGANRPRRGTLAHRAPTLTESVILSTAGGALGLAAGYAGIRALSAVSTVGLSRLGERGALLA